MRERFYARIASLLVAIANCEKRGNAEWRERHADKIAELVRQHAPHGSGFDNGTTLDMARSNGEKLVFSTAFHHMDENGYYDGWTEHVVTVRAHLAHGISITVSGRNRNGIRDYVAEQFHYLYSIETD